MYYFYYRPDFNVLDFLLCSYFINFHHQRFNSLNRVKFKRRLIRSNEDRRPQTSYNFILVIYRTDLLRQGIIRCLLFLKIYLYTSVAWPSGQKSDVQSVRTESRSDYSFVLSTYSYFDEKGCQKKCAGDNLER